MRKVRPWRKQIRLIGGTDSSSGNVRSRLLEGNQMKRKKVRVSIEDPGSMYCRECWGSTVVSRWWRPENPHYILCPECGSKKIHCVYTWRSKDGRRRKYVCNACGAKFSTTERFAEGEPIGRERRYRCKRCSAIHISEEFIENEDRRRA